MYSCFGKPITPNGRAENECLECEFERECEAKRKEVAMKKIYYIENLVTEWHRSIVGYYSSFENAKEALEYCADWYRPNGTGRIYEVELDTGEKYPKLVYVKE